MGSLRTLLALSVVFGHASLYVLVGGRLAVQLFYLISGFLIGYVLVQAGTYARKRDFWANRALRLFPVYLVVLVATAAWHLAGAGIDDTAFATIADAPPLAAAWLIVSNLALVGQDWLLFAGVGPEGLHVADHLADTELALYRGLLVPQAWTLGLELAFYAIAPFVLHRPRTVLALFVGSIALRAVLIAVGLGTQDPWTYRFFPTELALFLAGALSHRHLSPLWRRAIATRPGLPALVTGGLVLYCVVYLHLPYRSLHTLGLLAAFAVALPALFAFQRAHHWDSRVGDLSFPIYISHMLVLSVVSSAFAAVDLSASTALALAVVVVTLGVAWALERWVARPVERWRARVRESGIGSLELPVPDLPGLDLTGIGLPGAGRGDSDDRAGDGDDGGGVGPASPRPGPPPVPVPGGATVGREAFERRTREVAARRASTSAAERRERETAAEADA